MAVRQELVAEVIKYAVENDENERFHAALDEVMQALEKYPPAVWCQVGKIVAEEGAYRLIERMGVGYDGFDAVSANKLYTTENVTPLPEEV